MIKSFSVKQASNPVTKGAAAVPYTTTGPVGKSSDGYSLLRAAAYAVGAIGPESAKEEIEIGRRLEKAYRESGYYPSHGKMLIPIGTDHMPTVFPNGETHHEMKSIKTELAGMLRAALPSQIDADYVKKAMGTISATSGGTLVAPPQLGEVIELQRTFESFSAAGSRNVTLPPNGRIIFPKQTSATSGYWVEEAAVITESDIATGSLSLEAKKLGAMIRYSNELLRFASPDIEAMFRTDMAAQLGLTADAAMFDGTGGTQIKGLLTYPTVSTWTAGTDAVIAYTATTVGTNGNTFEPEDFIKMPPRIAEVAQRLPRTWIMRTGMPESIMSRRWDSVTASDGKGGFLYNASRGLGDPLPNMIYGDRLVTSNNVPHNRVKGSGTNLTVAIFGAFSEWIIARSGVLEIDLNPYDATGFPRAQSVLRALLWIDAGPRHLSSFAYADQLIN